MPGSHIYSGNGCPKCGVESRANKNRKTTEEFIEDASNIHGDKYDYSKVFYIDAHIKVIIVCSDHGDFEQDPHSHARGSGCPKCVGTKRKTTEEFMEDARKVHGDKYDYSKVVYINNCTKVIIGCPVHGDFEQKPEYHYSGSGCPICKESKGESAIRIHLTESSVNYRRQWRFAKSKISKSKFDFAVKHPMFTGVIEYQGGQHYIPASFGSKKKYAKLRGLCSAVERDYNKLQWCKKHNIPILIIPHWDKDRIPEILDDVMVGRTPTFSETPEKVKKYEPMRKAIRNRFGITEKEVLCGLVT